MNLNNYITTEDQILINDLTTEFLEFNIKKEKKSFSDDSSNIDSVNSLNNKTTETIDKKKSITYTYSDRINYFKNQLSNYYTNNKFLDFLKNISIKTVLPNKNVKRYYEMVLNNSSKERIIMGPLIRIISDDMDDDFFINMDTMTIPMRHTHLNENLNYVKTDFFYALTGNEKGPIKRFIDQVRMLDDHLKKLIQNYITNIKSNSPIYELVNQYKKNWHYFSIIYESGDKEYLSINYSKKSFNKDFKIGTRIYHGEELATDLMDQLADDTKNIYVSGDIYPIIKIYSITIYEKKINDKFVLTFKPKVYFADIFVKKDTLKYGIINKNNNNNNNNNSPLEQCKELLRYYNSKVDFSEFLSEISLERVFPLKEINNLFIINIKSSNGAPVYIGPINRSTDNDDEISLSDSNHSDFTINLEEMTLPMRHYHINKQLKFTSSNFYYEINGKENDEIKYFLDQVKRIDQHLKMLIRDYVKNLDEKSSLYSLLQKNKNIWIYQGIIKETNGKEYFSVDYYKRNYRDAGQIGTKIYDETELAVDLMKQLTDDSKNTYVYGDLYPLIKIDSIVVYEMKAKVCNIVCFKTKARFVNIIAKKNTLKYGIYSSKKETQSHGSDPLKHLTFETKNNQTITY
ncbi:hypothetical protein H8356DRAFT_1659275 [Neocallimastix lanati (nom. inval.)]|jgi:hypothetical protein|nr:hypothetical protein H8356DRAFT_1659275 [Neocallimastix sp. JGI-2020a]